MKKINFIIALTFIFYNNCIGQSGNPTNNLKCSCTQGGSSSSIQYPNGIGAFTNPGGVVNLSSTELSTSNKIRVEVSPHVTNTLNTGQWATTITIKLNGSHIIQSISPAGNPYSHQNGANSSVKLIPISSLKIGVNTICVEITCSGGTYRCENFCSTINITEPTNNPSTSTSGNTGTPFSGVPIKGTKIKRNVFAHIGWGILTPSIKVAELGSLNSKISNSQEASLEVTLPNRGKFVPAIGVSFSSSQLKMDNGVAIVQDKYPALSSQESNVVLLHRSNKANIIKGTIQAKITLPHFTNCACRSCQTQRSRKTKAIINTTFGGGIAFSYIKLSMPEVVVADKVIKTNSGQELPYLKMNKADNLTSIGLEPEIFANLWFSPRIALDLGVSYYVGSKLKTSVTQLVAKDSNNDKLFSASELSAGTLQTAENFASLNAFRIRAGLKINLSAKSNNYIGHVTLLR